MKSPQHSCAFRVFNKSGKMLSGDRRFEAKEKVVRRVPARPSAWKLEETSSVREEICHRNTLS